VGGVLLALGVITRPLALAFAVETAIITAAVAWPKGWIYSVPGGGAEFPFLLFAVYVAILLRENTRTSGLPQMLGRHGGADWGSQHVTMIFSGPGVKNGTSGHPARLTDIAPTIERFMGITPQARDGLVRHDRDAVVPVLRERLLFEIVAAGLQLLGGKEARDVDEAFRLEIFEGDVVVTRHRFSADRA